MTRPTMELGLEETCLLHMRKTKAQISCAVTAQLTNAIVFTTQIVQFLYFPNPEFQPSPEAIQPGLCRTWSDTLKIGFLATLLNGTLNTSRDERCIPVSSTLTGHCPLFSVSSIVLECVPGVTRNCTAPSSKCSKRRTHFGGIKGCWEGVWSARTSCKEILRSTVKPVLSGHSKKNNQRSQRQVVAQCSSKVLQNAAVVHSAILLTCIKQLSVLKT